MDQSISVLLKKIFEPIVYWAQDNRGKIFFTLFFIYVIGFPFLKYLQSVVVKAPTFLIDLIKNNLPLLKSQISVIDFLILLFVLFLFILIFKQHQKINQSKVLSDNFRDNLNKWIIPKAAVWRRWKGSVVESTGYVLSVTNSNFPGLIKGAFNWYDYSFSFEAKMDKNSKNANVGFFVRSEDSNNGVFIQLTEDEFVPHLLHNGTFFIDDTNRKILEVKLLKNQWHKVVGSVLGDVIKIDIDGYEIRYEIPSFELNVEDQELRKTLILSEVRDKDRKIQSGIREVVKYLDEIDELKKQGEEKENEINNAKKKADKAFEKIPKFTKLYVDFLQGSFGFRQSGQEHTYFKNLLLKRIN